MLTQQARQALWDEFRKIEERLKVVMDVIGSGVKTLPLEELESYTTEMNYLVIRAEDIAAQLEADYADRDRRPER